MSDHIENAGKKGYCFMWAIITILLFTILLIAVYQYNFKLTF